MSITMLEDMIKAKERIAELEQDIADMDKENNRLWAKNDRLLDAIKYALELFDTKVVAAEGILQKALAEGKDE